MAGATLNVHPRVSARGGTVRYEFDLVYSGRSEVRTLFYEVSGDAVPAPPDTFDGVLCAILQHAMAERRDIRLHGPATREALRNLAEVQRVWACWRPAVYQRIEIAVEGVDDTVQPERRALAAFSGGVDSTFTLLRHAASGDAPRYPVDTTVLVHGFDVALGNGDAFAELVARIGPVRQLARTGLAIVRTNSKALRLLRWEDSCGAELAACLHLFSTDFSHALIGGSDPYDDLALPWGTNPITDHLLSGGGLAIVHDGSGFSRTEKVERLAAAPAALQSLKVCWEGPQQGRNCGECEKCVRTQLNLLAVGVADAPIFDRRFDVRALRQLPIESDLALQELRSIVDYGVRRGLDAEWFRTLRQRVSKGRSPHPRPPTLRGRIRRSLARVRLLDAARQVRSKLTFLAMG